MSSGLDDMLTMLEGVDSHSLRYEIKVLRAIKAWAVRQACDFTAGDKVEMTDSLNLSNLNGWAPYRECMAPGATATVRRVDFNEHYGYWYADIVFDREWAVSTFGGGVIRFWHGPADETPEGYEPPSSYDRTNHPEGRRHTFAMPVRHLRRVPAESAERVR